MLYYITRCLQYINMKQVKNGDSLWRLCGLLTLNHMNSAKEAIDIQI